MIDQGASVSKKWKARSYPPVSLVYLGADDALHNAQWGNPAMRRLAVSRHNSVIKKKAGSEDPAKVL
jgi:hypothetical protein